MVDHEIEEKGRSRERQRDTERERERGRETVRERKRERGERDKVQKLSGGEEKVAPRHLDRTVCHSQMKA